MANRGVRIPFLADVSDFLRGTKRIEDELGNIGDELRTAARDADRASDGIGDSFADEFKDASRAGKAAADDISDAFRKAANDTERAFKSADMSDSFTGVKDEAADTAREVAASFDGSADSIAGGFQELAANAGASFGAIGVALGGALAAGIGMIWQTWQETQARIEEGAANMFGALIEQGNVLSAEWRKQQLVDALMSDPDKAKAIARISEVAGPRGMGLLYDAIGGNKAASDELIQILQRAQAGKWWNRNEGAIGMLVELQASTDIAYNKARLLQQVYGEIATRQGAAPAAVREERLNQTSARRS